MTRYLLALAGLLLSAFAAFAIDPPAAPALDPPAAPAVIAAGQAVADAVSPRDATVRVRAGNGSGSGVCVYADGEHSLILTNRHVAEHVAADAKVRVNDADGWVMAWSDTDDLALVWTLTQFPAAPIADGYPAAGEPLTLWGYGGGKLAAKAGKAMGYQGARLLTGGPVYEAGFLSISGDSGGGVFNAAGELVAVNWGNDGVKSSCVGLTATRTFVKVKAGPRFPRLAARLGRNPAPQAPAKAAAPAKCVDGCPCPNNPPAAPPPKKAEADPFQFALPAAPRCTLQPVYDARGRVVGYRQVCPQAK